MCTTSGPANRWARSRTAPGSTSASPTRRSAPTAACCARAIEQATGGGRPLMVLDAAIGRAAHRPGRDRRHRSDRGLAVVLAEDRRGSPPEHRAGRMGINRDANIAASVIARCRALRWRRCPATRRVAQRSRYPGAGPIRLIVPFAPAGPVDILARVIVDPLAKQLGQSVVIENRGGAGGNIAIAAAARAKPDGYTLLLCSSTLVVNPLLYKSVPYDPVKDFVPISLLGTSPNLMLAKPDFAKGHAGVHRHRQGQARATQLFDAGHRHQGAFRGRTAQAARRDRPRARAVSERRAGRAVAAHRHDAARLDRAAGRRAAGARAARSRGSRSAANGAGARCPTCRQ